MSEPNPVIKIDGLPIIDKSTRQKLYNHTTASDAHSSLFAQKVNVSDYPLSIVSGKLCITYEEET